MKLPREWLILSLLITSYFLLFAFLSVAKHRSFHSTYLDLGLEAQSIWNTSQGRFLKVSFGPDGEEISALSYHVSPIIVFLAPLYKLWPSVELLLVVQTFLLALGAVPLYLLARDILKSQVLSFALVLAYLLYPPLQWSNLADFHPQTLATPLLLSAFWFMWHQHWRWFYLFFLLSLLTKENLALVLATLGFFHLWRVYQNSQPKTPLFVRIHSAILAGVAVHGWVIIAVSVFWFLVSVYFVMPYFSGGQMGAVGRYEYLGRTPWEIATKVVTDPAGDLRILLMLPKVKYLFHLLVSTGFLPLLAPQYLLPAVSEFFLNLFSAYNPQWQVKFHYTAAITPFIFVASVYGLAFLRRFLEGATFVAKVAPFQKTNFALATYLVAIALFWNYVHSPSPLSKDFDRSVYTVTVEDKEREKVLQRIPTAASVSAMNNLGAHLANRRYLWRFPSGVEKADYIVVDPSLPGKSFDLAQISEDDFGKIWAMLLSEKRFFLYRQSADLVILRRVGSQL